MAANAETKQLKENCKKSAVIEQDLIQLHPENPVNPIKRLQSLCDHKNVRRTNIF